MNLTAGLTRRHFDHFGLTAASLIVIVDPELDGIHEPRPLSLA